MKKSIALLIALGLSTPNLIAAPQKPNKYVLCKNQKIVRTIRVSGESDSCKTTYTKAGIDRIIGTAKTFQGCQSFLNNVKGNLESANWKCKDISQSKLDSDPKITITVKE